MSEPPLFPDSSQFPQKPYPPPYEGVMQQQGAAPSLRFYQPQPQAAPVIMVRQTQPQMIVMSALPLGSRSTNMICHNCRNEIKTTTDKKPSRFAWNCASVMCFFGLIFGCCLIPFCMDSCMDTHHSCPNCGAHLGTHRAF